MTENEVIIAFIMGLVVNCVQVALLMVALRRTGLHGGWVLLGLAPILGFAGQYATILNGTLTPSEAVVLFAAFLLLPYLILAFKSWPVVAKHDLRPET